MSAGSFFRASVRRARGLAPVWVGPRLLRPDVEHVGSDLVLNLDILSGWPDAPAPTIEDCTGGTPPLSGTPVQAPTGAPFAGGGDSFAGDLHTARDGMGCEALAPEGTSGARQEDGPPANASESHIEIHAKASVEAVVAHMREATEEGVSRLAARRSAAATSEIMDVTAGETAPEQDGRMTSAPSKTANKGPRTGLQLAQRDQTRERPRDTGGVTAGETAPLPRRRAPSLGLIDLRLVPSEMDLRAQQQLDIVRAKVAPRPPRPGMTTCRCSDGFLVPDTFGRDCIEPRCPLKGAKAGAR
ncbi:hypothetical protein [Novosphingobium rosa]|uniref:hypothetical protein n=1 Tax=Novosphingobium rosa TaxID=76978 RepID=UPI000834DD9A|nr:hypothetical protein [Novosphingobium rosa]